MDIELNCAKCSEFVAHAHDMGTDIAKLAVTPHSYMDVVAVEEATLSAGAGENGCVCTISMGGLGKHSRVTLPVYGSKLTYAAVGDATAPGQMTADVVRYMLDALGA